MSETKLDNSPEGLLKRMRSGYKPIKLVFGELEVDARLVPGSELATAISNAKFKVKVPEGHDRKMLEGQAVMKAILKVATTVGPVAYLGDKFLNSLSNDELVYLHDQYESKAKECNPKFESLSYDQIAQIIGDIKKKKTVPSAYYMWQLAAIGEHFLKRLPAMVSGAGGS